MKKTVLIVPPPRVGESAVTTFLLIVPRPQDLGLLYVGIDSLEMERDIRRGFIGSRQVVEFTGPYLMLDSRLVSFVTPLQAAKYQSGVQEQIRKGLKIPESPENTARSEEGPHGTYL